MITSTSTAHVLNNRLGYWNQLTKLCLHNQTIYQLSPVTINSKQTKPFGLQMALLLPLCVFLVNRRLLHWLPSRNMCLLHHVMMTWSHSHINWPCTNNSSSLLAGARMPVVDQNHQKTLQASLQHCCQVNVSLVEWNPWDSVGVCITESSDRCVHKVAQPTHVAER